MAPEAGAAPPAPASLGADRRCLALVCLFLLAVYLLTTAGRVISGDGETMYLTTKALVTDGTLAIAPRPEAAQGRDGRWYSKYGLGQSVAQLPFFVSGYAAGKVFGAPDDRAARFAVGMTNSVITAGLAGLFWLTVRLLPRRHDGSRSLPQPATGRGSHLGVGTEIGRGAATGATLVFGLATLAWPYARSDFAEPLQAAAVLSALYGAIRWRRAPHPKWAALVGVAAGGAFLTKAASGVLLPPLGLYFAWALWEQRGRGATALAGHVAAAALPFGLCVMLQAGMNLARFGSVTEFGYGDEPRTGFTTPLLSGIGYLLLSPGKGLFLFAPPVLAGAIGLVWLARRAPLEAATAALVFMAELLYFGRWWAWHGDWCWGPRYLVVTVPFLMLGWGSVLDGWARRSFLLKGVAGALIGAGLTVSLLGVLVDYGAYFSVTGAQLGRGVDVRDARLVPEFSPILGHAWLARATLYETAVDLQRGSAGEPDDRPENPVTWEYPWRFAYPAQRPEDPSRAFGFDLWFTAVRDRSPFLAFWSSLGAAWLALALLPLGAHLWSAARTPAPPGEPAASRRLGLLRRRPAAAPA